MSDTPATCPKCGHRPHLGKKNERCASCFCDPPPEPWTMNSTLTEKQREFLESLPPPPERGRMADGELQSFYEHGDDEIIYAEARRAREAEAALQWLPDAKRYAEHLEALLTKLKEECETQYVRAERAEAERDALRAALEKIAGWVWHLWNDPSYDKYPTPPKATKDEIESIVREWAAHGDITITRTFYIAGDP